MMSESQDLLAEFKSLKASIVETKTTQEQFRRTLSNHTEQYGHLDKKLGQVVLDLNKTIERIPKSVVVTQEFRVNPRSWYYLGLMVLLVVLAIWFTPSAKQSLRELQMERDYESMQEHLDYHIRKNPNTEKGWREQHE